MPHFRKRIRLKGYDYAKPGIYFVTISTENYEWSLSNIDQDTVKLSPIGKIIQDNIVQLPIRHPTVQVLNSVIMPNHVHLLLFLSAIDESRPKRLFNIVGAMKSGSTRECREAQLIAPNKTLWMRSFHERVVRDDAEMERFSAYIDANPGRWREDEILLAKIHASGLPPAGTGSQTT